MFVDIHSHVVPSGDDGVGSVGEGHDLCREAARRGTRVLFATPHVWPHMLLSPEREAAVRRAFAELAPRAGLELRLGFELSPTRALLREDLRRYALEGTDALLVEVPFLGPIDVTVAVAERAADSGLTPVIAHPERSEEILERPQLADELAARGWVLQVNATSLVGYHGPTFEELGWELLESGTAALVASDGHRRSRPPYLDEAFALACERLGEERALRLFDGSALGLASARRFPFRAASRGA